MSLKTIGGIVVVIMIYLYAFGQLAHDGIEKSMCENNAYKNSFNSKQECSCVVDKMQDYLGGNLVVGFKMVKQFFGYEVKEGDLKNMPMDFFKKECRNNNTKEQ